jgi:hypothetical protein
MPRNDYAGPSGPSDVDGQDEQDPPAADRMGGVKGEVILSAKPILPILT